MRSRLFVGYSCLGMVALGFGLLSGCGGGIVPPADAKATCAISPVALASMFHTGAVTLDGVVDPANSQNFPAMAHNCDFYTWSEQMFLWLNSPAPPNYGGGGGRIFESPVFFDVSPQDMNGQRTFIRHNPGGIINMSIRDFQEGPHGLSIVISQSGALLEVEKPLFSKNGRQLVLNAKGDTVEIGRIILGEKGAPAFFDVSGKPIAGVKPIIRPQLLKQVEFPSKTKGGVAVRALARPGIVQSFAVDNAHRFFMDANGSVVPVESGQADNSVLIAQNGSLVYYAIMVNDVYAYFHSAIRNGMFTCAFPPCGSFPTGPSDLSQVTAFARSQGATLPDSNALAIEVKTSWVETTGLANLNSYITIQAKIPTYDRTNPKHWVPTGTRVATLAMVGMHVVGSTNEHPEMIWATFEHFKNAPNAAYSYINNGDATINVPQVTGGSWVFCADGAADPFNEQHANFRTPNIDSFMSFAITPSNIIRWKPWGAASDQGSNGDDANAAASNTEIIAINNSVHGGLAAGDIRTNYNLHGATWFFGQSPPAQGTRSLCNTTMETFQQGTNTLFATGANCFTCHMGIDTNVSHIFTDLKPLF